MEDPKLNDAYADVLTQVGLCLDAWSRIESALAAIFADISGMPVLRAHVVMASIISLDARVNVCANVMPEMLAKGDLLSIWERLAAKVLKQAKKRNEIAHFSVMEVNKGGKMKPVLIPYFSLGQMALKSDAFLEGKPPAHMTADQINERTGRFNKLADALRWFQDELRVKRGTQPTNPEPEPDLIGEIRKLIAQIAEGKEPPPQSCCC